MPSTLHLPRDGPEGRAAPGLVRFLPERVIGLADRERASGTHRECGEASGYVCPDIPEDKEQEGRLMITTYSGVFGVVLKVD